MGKHLGRHIKAPRVAVSLLLAAVIGVAGACQLANGSEPDSVAAERVAAPEAQHVVVPEMPQREDPQIGEPTSLPVPTPPAPTPQPRQTTPAPTATGRTNTPSDPDAPPAFGVQFHGTWDMYFTASGSVTPNQMFYRHLDQLRRNHVQVLRVDVGWSTSQPSTAPPSADQWYNKRIALVLDQARARGMQVFLTLHQSPLWARAEAPSSNVKRFPTDPNRIRPWATWMARTFGDRVLAWEVWNEPNLTEFTGISDPRERAVAYVPLLKATSQALKAGDRDAVVVFGGPCQTDDGFIAEAYARGAQPYFDVMAVHPYQGNQTRAPESTDLRNKARMTNLPSVLDVMAEHGDGNKPVWWTEFGYSVHSNANVPEGQTWRLGVSSNQQSADYLKRSFELAREEYPQVRLAVVYTAYKTPSDSYGHQYGYRIMEADGTALPQLTTVGRYMEGFRSERALF